MRHRAPGIARRVQLALLVPVFAVSLIIPVAGAELCGARAVSTAGIDTLGGAPPDNAPLGVGANAAELWTAAPTRTATARPSLVAARPAPPARPPGDAVSSPSVPSARRPDQTSTGVPVGTVLTPSGSLRITTPNQVIDGLDIAGAVSVEASGVVIKNSRIHGGDPYGIDVRSGCVTISDTEISGFENGIAGDDWTGSRVNIHSVYGDGVKLGSDVTLQDSWIHDLSPAPDAHADGGQMQDGVRNLVVRNNVIDLSNVDAANSALFLAPDFGPSSDGPVTIDGNWLDGGNFTLYCVDGNDGQYIVKSISVTNNEFGRGAKYGPADVNVPISQSGNIWADTGATLVL